MTGQSAGNQVIATTAGTYPKSMDALVDQDGHISLNPDDYRAYARDEVETFLASRPYETHVLFAPDGTILAMKSQWSEDNVTFNMRDDSSSIRAHGGMLAPGDGYTDMHFHPESTTPGDHTLKIFSGYDVEAYTVQIDASVHGTWSYPLQVPNTFRVKAFDGTWFELRYVGGGKKSYKKFKTAYKSQKTRAENKAYDFVRDHGALYDGFVSDEITAKSHLWLTAHAKDYGFEYNSNWTTKPIS